MAVEYKLHHSLSLYVFESTEGNCGDATLSLLLPYSEEESDFKYAEEIQIPCQKRIQVLYMIRPN